MNTKLNKILTAFLTALMALVIFAGCSQDSGESADKPKKDYSNIEMKPNISIPGYGSLELKAGKKKQSVSFYNPAENTCFFKISLVLEADDGTGKAAGGKEAKGNEPGGADVTEAENSAPGKETVAEAEDTVLWSSELLEPGESVKSIKLERALQSGEYAAIIKYECFSLSDNTTLNGANISVTLEVR